MTTLTLSASLDTVTARPLFAQLSELRGVDLNIDASGVERLGAQALQVLLAARKCWQSDGRVFRVWNPSEGLRDALAMAGAQILLEEGHTA
ncbi:MAG: STAS domain-containing protein [Alphaproteobacteria bacterium]|nr:STAS domain-containing protein [Alphaproteobacteria bacterium]